MAPLWTASQVVPFVTWLTKLAKLHHSAAQLVCLIELSSLQGNSQALISDRLAFCFFLWQLWWGLWSFLSNVKQNVFCSWSNEFLSFSFRLYLVLICSGTEKRCMRPFWWKPISIMTSSFFWLDFYFPRLLRFFAFNLPTYVDS